MHSKSPTLYVVRHGRTPWNAEGRLQGQRDIPLEDFGRDQARGNGRLLKSILGPAEGFVFISSPLIRARETMELIRAEMSLPPQAYECDERIKEVCFGDWEGKTRRNLQQECPDLLADRDQDGWNFTPPKGESYAEMSQRIEAWLRNTCRDSIVVAHGGVMRILQVLVSDAPRQQATDLPAPQDQVMRIRGNSIEWLVQV